MCQTVCYSDWIALFAFDSCLCVRQCCWEFITKHEYGYEYEYGYESVCVWHFCYKKKCALSAYIATSTAAIVPGKHTVKMATIWWNMAHMNGSNYEPTALSTQTIYVKLELQAASMLDSKLQSVALEWNEYAKHSQRRWRKKGEIKKT